MRGRDRERHQVCEIRGREITRVCVRERGPRNLWLIITCSRNHSRSLPTFSEICASGFENLQRKWKTRELYYIMFAIIKNYI